MNFVCEIYAVLIKSSCSHMLLVYKVLLIWVTWCRVTVHGANVLCSGLEQRGFKISIPFRAPILL